MVIVTTEVVCFQPADDRSVGEAGHVLRHSLLDAMAPAMERGDEVFDTLTAALQKAKDLEGTLVSYEVFEKVLAFVSALPARFPLPRLVVESETEIGLDWDEARRRVMSLTIDSTDQVGFSALIGTDVHYGRFQFGEGIPRTLDFLFSRMYPSTRRR